MRKEKQLLLDDLASKIRESKGFIVAQYKGFSVTRSNQFRNHLAELGAEFEVVRKRVFLKAAESSGVQLDLSDFSGHIGVIFTMADATAVIKSAMKFAEDNENSVIPLTGQIEDAICSQADLQAIAKLPGLNEMRAQVVGLLQAPMSQTVGILQALLASPLYCLEEKVKKS